MPHIKKLLRKFCIDWPVWLWKCQWLVDIAPEPLKPLARFLGGVRSQESLGGIPDGGITVVITAHNEARDIEQTIRAIQGQTLLPQEIIVIDDGSIDQTGDIARRAGATVYHRERKPDGKTQGKAAGQKFGLSVVKTTFVILIDADTDLKYDAIEKMMPYFNEPKTVAVGGYVLPKYVDNFWEKLRQFQYHFGFSVIKAGQNNTGTIFVSSGCFTGFRTAELRKVFRVISRRQYRKSKKTTGVWAKLAIWILLQTRKRVRFPRDDVCDRAISRRQYRKSNEKLSMSLAEDQLYTWILLQMGKDVRFARDALCYVVDPTTPEEYNKQNYRWNAGTFHNLKDYSFNLFPMGFWFAIHTYFIQIYTLVGPVFEVWALWTIGESFFVQYAMPRAIRLTMSLLDFAPFLPSSLALGALGTLAVVASALWSLLLGSAIGLVVVIIFIWIPVMWSAVRMKEDKRVWLTAWAVFPFMIVHYLDVALYYAAFWNEIILWKRLNRWDKGHSEDGAPPIPPLSAQPKNRFMFYAHQRLAQGTMDVASARKVTALGIPSMRTGTTKRVRL